MIDFGRLRERVTIQKATERRNAIGETVQTWEPFAERWASVDGLSSREVLLQGQQQTEVSHRVRMRYVTDMTSTMRILWRGRVLEIASLLEHGNRSHHEERVAVAQVIDRELGAELASGEPRAGIVEELLERVVLAYAGLVVPHGTFVISSSQSGFFSGWMSWCLVLANMALGR